MSFTRSSVSQSTEPYSIGAARMTLKDALSEIVFTRALHQICYETPNI